MGQKWALPSFVLVNLTNMGLLPRHAVEWRIVRNRFEYRHATKGWRGRSLNALRALGAFTPPATAAA